MSTSPLRFDDLEVGLTSRSGPYPVTREEIIGFSSRWDPRPFHLDDGAAEAGGFGGLIAPAAFTLCVCVLLATSESPATAAVAGLGMDRVRWPQPVRPGDTLWQETRITELRPSRSLPDRGIVRGDRRLWDDERGVVMTAEVTWMVER